MDIYIVVYYYNGLYNNKKEYPVPIYNYMEKSYRCNDK